MTAAALVTPGKTPTPVFTKILLRLDPVNDLTSEAATDSKNLTNGLLDFLMALTNLINLVKSMIFRLLPVISSKIHRRVAQGRS